MSRVSEVPGSAEVVVIGEEAADTADAARIVNLAMELASPEDRRLLDWHIEKVGDGFIAERLNISKDAAKKRRQRCIESLKVEIQALSKLFTELKRDRAGNGATSKAGLFESLRIARLEQIRRSRDSQ